MMKRLVGWLVLVPLSAVLAAFALANRHWIVVYFDPFTQDNPLVPSLSTPLFGVVYGALLIGIVLGGVATWITQGRNRREKRQLKRENIRLQEELSAARSGKNAANRSLGLPDTDDLLELE